MNRSFFRRRGRLYDWDMFQKTCSHFRTKKPSSYPPPPREPYEHGGRLGVTAESFELDISKLFFGGGRIYVPVNSYGHVGTVN